MNYILFERQLKAAYQQSGCKFTFEECSNIFSEFFRDYRAYTGKNHPPLRTSKLVDLLNSIDGEGLFIPECYSDMIDGYFQTHFPRCDYNICHFFSGRIRELRFYETIY